MTFSYPSTGIQLPGSLQSLGVGNRCNQRLEAIQLPNSLQILTFGGSVNKSLDGMQLPSLLQHLMFGYSFNNSLEGIHLPSSVQSFTFGQEFNQSLDGIQLPRAAFEVGQRLQPRLGGYPTTRQSVAFDVWLTTSLPTTQQYGLTFGHNFNDGVECIQLSSRLQLFDAWQLLQHSIEVSKYQAVCSF